MQHLENPKSPNRKLWIPGHWPGGDDMMQLGAALAQIPFPTSSPLAACKQARSSKLSWEQVDFPSSSATAAVDQRRCRQAEKQLTELVGESYWFTSFGKGFLDVNWPLSKSTFLKPKLFEKESQLSSSRPKEQCFLLLPSTQEKASTRSVITKPYKDDKISKHGKLKYLMYIL